MMNMFNDVHELNKELEDKVLEIRQETAEADEALRKEINRVADENKLRMDQIFKLDEEYAKKRKQILINA